MLKGYGLPMGGDRMWVGVSVADALELWFLLLRSGLRKQ